MVSNWFFGVIHNIEDDSPAGCELVCVGACLGCTVLNGLLPSTGCVVCATGLGFGFGASFGPANRPSKSNITLANFDFEGLFAGPKEAPKPKQTDLQNQTLPSQILK